MAHRGAIAVVPVLAVAGFATAGLGPTAPASASPSPGTTVTQTFAYGGPTGYGEDTLTATSYSDATVAQGSDFTITDAGGTQVVPTTNSGATVNFIFGNVNYYPIPSGATYQSAVASGDASYTTPSGYAGTLPATGAFPVVITYCTTAGQAGCTATPTTTPSTTAGVYNGFLGSTSLPYLEVGTGSTQIPGGATLTLPSVTVTLKATGAGGTTLDWTQSEFDTSANVSVGTIIVGLVVKVLGYPAAVVSSLPSPTAPPYAPPPILTSTTIVTPPGAPTIDTATAAGGQVTLTWSAPTSDGGSPVTGYVITPSTSSGTGTPITVGDVTSYTVTGLTNGTTYTFTVAAINAVGTGPDSAASNPATPAEGFPGPPTITRVTAGDGEVTIAWSAPTVGGGSPITGYIITPSSGMAAGVGDVTSDIVTGLTNGTTYTFTVAAVNATGVGAASTPSDPVTPTGPPGAPAIVTATPGYRQATITWSAPTSDGGSPVTGYVITPSTGAGTGTPIGVGDVTSYTVTGLTDGSSYTFTVAAINALGISPDSAASEPVVPQMTAPGAPAITKATAGDGVATVTWIAPASDGGSPVTGYVITPSTSAGTGTSITVGDVTTDTVTGLTDGTAYTFSVAAINAIGTGPDSAASDPVTPTGPPGAPTIGTATASVGGATVTWSAPASDGGSPVTGYVITPSTSAGAGSPTTVGDVTSDTVTGLTVGTAYTFTVAAINAIGTGPDSAASDPVTPLAAVPPGEGYWLVGAGGSIYALGDAHAYGSTVNEVLNKPIVGMAATPDGQGYWLVAADGGVFTFGDAHFYGSTGNKVLNKPIVGMTATPDGQGYWLVAADGGVFTFGDAHFYGSTGNKVLAKPIVGMAATPDGHGYSLVGADGGIYTFGDAHSYGSAGNKASNEPILGMTGT